MASTLSGHETSLLRGNVVQHLPSHDLGIQTAHLLQQPALRRVLRLQLRQPLHDALAPPRFVQHDPQQVALGPPQAAAARLRCFAHSRPGRFVRPRRRPAPRLELLHHRLAGDPQRLGGAIHVEIPGHAVAYRPKRGQQAIERAPSSRKRSQPALALQQLQLALEHVERVVQQRAHGVDAAAQRHRVGILPRWQRGDQHPQAGVQQHVGRYSA
jgi:hypothetical protein